MDENEKYTHSILYFSKFCKDLEFFFISFEKIPFHIEILTQKVELWLFSLSWYERP